MWSTSVIGKKKTTFNGFDKRYTDREFIPYETGSETKDYNCKNRKFDAEDVQGY
jgi:hypothetical protein